MEKSCEDYKKLIFAEESKLHECIVEYDGNWNDMRQVFVDSLMMRHEATKGLQYYAFEVTWVLDQFHPLRDFISCVESTNIEVDMVVGSYLEVVGPHRQPGKDEESCLSNEFKMRVGLKGPNRSVLVDALAAVQDADAVINRSKLLVRQTEACREFFVEADMLSLSFFTEIESLYESMVNSGTVKHMKQIKCDSDLMYRTIDDIVSGFGTRPGFVHDNECSVVECKCASFEVEIPKFWENDFCRLNMLRIETDILEAMLREINMKAQTVYELIKLEYAKKVEETKIHYRKSVTELYNVIVGPTVTVNNTVNFSHGQRLTVTVTDSVGQLHNGFVASFMNTRAFILKQSKLYKLPSKEKSDNNSVRLYKHLFTRCDAFVEKVEQLGQFDMLFSDAPTEYCDVSDNVKKFETIVQSYEANARRFYGTVADQHNLGFSASTAETAYKVTISLDIADRNRTNGRTFGAVTFKSSPVVVVQKIYKPLAFDKKKYISAHGDVAKLTERLVKLSNNLISESLNKHCVCQLRLIRAKIPSLMIESQKTLLRAIDRRVNFCEHILVARQDAIFNRDRFNCSICLDDVKPGDGLVLSECLHTFCK